MRRRAPRDRIPVGRVGGAEAELGDYAGDTPGPRAEGVGELLRLDAGPHAKPVGAAGDAERMLRRSWCAGPASSSWRGARNKSHGEDVGAAVYVRPDRVRAPDHLPMDITFGRNRPAPRTMNEFDTMTARRALPARQRATPAHEPISSPPGSTMPC